ncbi:MAG: hypothetical protein WCJ56_03205 [bacterium]
MQTKTKRSYIQTAPGRLEAREGAGCLALFGMPFLLAGLFLLLGTLHLLPITNQPELFSWLTLVMLLMGLVFTAVGGGLVFGRSWTIIDLSTGSISTAMGLLVPMKWEQRALQEFSAVVIRHNPGDSDSAETFPVVLLGATEMQLCSSTQFGESYQDAEMLATFLGLPLQDATTSHITAVIPAQAAAPQQSSLDDTAFPQPPQLRSRIENIGGKIRITIPNPGISPVLPIGLVAFLGTWAVFLPPLLRFFNHTHTPPLVQMVFVSFFGFLFGLLPLLGFLGSILTAVRGFTRVTAAATGIVIEVQGAWRRNTLQIPATDILDLDYGTRENEISSATVQTSTGQSYAAPSWATQWIRSAGITIKAKSGLHTFGAGLPDDEVRFLYSLVKQWVGGRK